MTAKQELSKRTVTTSASATAGPPAVAELQTDVAVGSPTEQLQVEEPTELEVVYPTGPQLWLNVAAIMLFSFIRGLDLLIVAPTVPALTDHFNTVSDIGWYSSAYGLATSASNFLFGKMYTLFDMKKVYVVSVTIFELGSILCTFAPSSGIFIVGRAVAGLGAAGAGVGTMLFTARSFPVEQRPKWNGVLGFAQTVGMVSAPALGGALIDAFSWRVCYGICIPPGFISIIISVYWMKDLYPNPDLKLPLREKMCRLDLVGTLLVMPLVACLMTALIWGGVKYSWKDWRIIVLFSVFVVLCVAFGYMQHLRGDKAIVPLRLLRNRTVLATTLYGMCINGLLAVTENYIAIYLQGVKGYSAAKSGLLGLPMIVGLGVTSLLASVAAGWLGHYTPFLYATSIFTPIASGILTTIDIDQNPSKVAALLGFLGVAVGFGIQNIFTALMTVLTPDELALAIGVVSLGCGLGSAGFIAISATLFQNRLAAEIHHYSPSTNITRLEDHGLSGLRMALGPDRLRQVLFGYNEAVVQTLYIPLALGLLTIVGSMFTEVKSTKKRD